MFDPNIDFNRLLDKMYSSAVGNFKIYEVEHLPSDVIADQRLREKAVELCVKSSGRFDKDEAEEIYQFLKGEPQEFNEPK